MSHKVVCLVGPTACGKTELSLFLAGLIPGLELVYADSMAVYRHLDTGTAKPTVTDRAKVPHHLVDFLDPAQRWSAFAFSKAARRVIQEIRERGGVPLVVGGTGFYLQSFCQPLPPGSAPDERLRLTLERFTDEKLYALLKFFDSRRAERIGRHNRMRLIRALEIWYRTGTFPSAFARSTLRYGAPEPVVLVGVRFDRETIRTRIVQRVDRMFSEGILAETADLLHRGYRSDIPAFQNFTYAPVVRAVLGSISVNEAREAVIRGTFAFLKRQNTWFRRIPIHWIEREGRTLQEIAEEIGKRLGRFEQI
ncbi:MAG TPA: tRNA (adenosine(37)-N6)-dimethylallyltransferase MiaA [Atribacteraceae bacterium]|nr:tRNA (adenosine(37)-N6)-dimethylallyltransferase MiaA [Atribacteraceae bacterium]